MPSVTEVTISELTAQIYAPNVLLVDDAGEIVADLPISYLLKQIIYQLDKLNEALAV